MNKYRNMLFFAPDDGGGDGGADAGNIAAGGGGEELSHGEAAFEPTPKMTTGEPALPKGSGSKGAETGEHAKGVQDGQVPPVAPSGAFDASKFAKEFGDSLSTTLKPILEQRATPPVEKMSPEEAKKLLNIWEPDDAWYAKYDNLQTRADAVKEMRDGIALQSDTLNQMRMQEQINKLREEFMPALTTMAQAENARREERFTTKYPQLQKPELQPLIKAIADDFVNNKKTFKTEGELFKALAGGVEAVLKVNNPNFTLEEAGASTNAGTNGDQDKGRSGRQLPVTSPGGGGGTGRRDTSDKSGKPRGLTIFDKV